MEMLIHMCKTHIHMCQTDIQNTPFYVILFEENTHTNFYSISYDSS